jgi:hypothetical protein
MSNCRMGEEAANPSGVSNEQSTDEDESFATHKKFFFFFGGFLVVDDSSCDTFSASVTKVDQTWQPPRMRLPLPRVCVT